MRSFIDEVCAEAKEFWHVATKHAHHLEQIKAPFAREYWAWATERALVHEDTIAKANAAFV